MPDIAQRIRDAEAAGDHAAVVHLLATRPVEAWFTLPTEELTAIIVGLPADAVRASAEVALVARMLAPEGAEALTEDRALSRSPHLPAHLRRWLVVTDAWHARLHGDVARAYEVLIRLPEIEAAVPSVLDPTNGIRSLFLTQAAVTALLLGRFREALSLYGRTLCVPTPAALRFYLREAHLRSALIHVLYGDPAAARAHLAEARSTPRTQSWMESQLDPEQVLVEALISEQDPVGAFTRILQLTYGSMGELWPLYLLGLQRQGVLAGRRLEARERIEALVAAGMGTNGTALNSSVPHVALAFEALLNGNVPGAKNQMKAVEDRSWPAVIVGCMIGIASGAPKAAIRELNAARPMTEGLRQAERQRSLVLGLAHYLSGDSAAARAAVDQLEELNRRSGPHEIAVMRILAPSLLELVAERIPELLPEVKTRGDRGVLDTPSLTESELAVLVRLAQGETRDQIAKALFRSPNTVKSHQASLYRKLGVSAAADAVRLATEAGYL
ncbi:LuxR C-terminal-related transcriptional regulator [Microbacterium sp. Au-Mic1]|uniref:helix-turn-helix transcriptional regulator n=1 Tax=Microbacterium sp. Au-Mic1 TaxID=2906457 RepID=UPI001E64FE8A|nr:LuxR C-terminal-related transcriptional regulator [Microbacterium sp. Au-Mic1]MCE4027821.1 LuxR C-terminal-related transcriptional regulator [Microbacterium sp. Au-Mic1]